MSFVDFDKIDLFYAYVIILIIIMVSMWYHNFVYKDTCVKQTEKEKNYMDYINTAHSGMVRGLVFGIILGDAGLYTGIKNAAIYGVVNPLFLYFGY